MTVSPTSLFYGFLIYVIIYQTAVYATGRITVADESASVLCRDFISTRRIHGITAVVDQSASVPCRAFISAKRINGIVTLIRWFHSSLHKPLYTLDIRSLNISLSTDASIIHKGRHFPSPETEGRFYLDLSLNPISLRIDPVSLEDAGVYKCQIEFKYKRSVQSTVNLDIVVPPKEAIIFNATGMKVEGIIGPFYIGQSLQLTCESLGGNPKPVANWKCNIPEFHRVIINGSDLTMHSLNRQDQWCHCTCTVQNTNMTAPKSVTVIIELVLPPMELLLYSNTHRPFISGESVQISCQSFGSYPRAHVVWKKDEESLKAEERITDNGNVTTSIIEFMAQASDDGKEMQCIAFNPDMKNYILRRSFIIKVHYIPEVQIVILSNQSQISEGHNLALLCNVKSNPKASNITWTFEDEYIFNSTSIVVKENTLYIKFLKLSHIGRFHCMAENERGVGKDYVLINVKHKPQCKEMDINYNYNHIKNAVNVTCNLDAYPEDVTFYWLHRNSSSNSSWTTSQVSHTRLELQESDSEIYCWGINDIGVQTSPCRFLLSKGSSNRTSFLQDLIISSCAVIFCCIVIFIVLRRYRYIHNSVIIGNQMVNIKDNCGKFITNCAEPSISSTESDSSTTPLKILKNYQENSTMDKR